MTPLDIICVGETMAVVTPTGAQPLSTATECLLGFGGAESNVAAHLAEFGYWRGWASRLGQDPFGDRIMDKRPRLSAPAPSNAPMSARRTATGPAPGPWPRRPGTWN
jgi:hypothetical protein